jgi:hypothetical protein
LYRGTRDGFDSDEFHSRCDGHSNTLTILKAKGSEFIIADNANTTNESHSNLGFPYKHPQFAHGTNEALTFLAGSFHFQLDEIEVYEKE